MNFLFIATIINFTINALITLIVYKLLQNFKDLGTHKVKFKLNEIKRHNSLKSFFEMTIIFNNQQIRQVISEDDYNNLYGSTETYVNIREYQKFYLNPNLSKYDFSLENNNWEYIDKKSCKSGFLYAFSIFEFLLVVTTLQI